MNDQHSEVTTARFDRSTPAVPDAAATTRANGTDPNGVDGGV